jgi:hypothetical protein
MAKSAGDNKRTKEQADQMRKQRLIAIILGFSANPVGLQMVPMEGVEPTHPYGYQILSLARLPIPPHRPR